MILASYPLLAESDLLTVSQEGFEIPPEAEGAGDELETF